MQSQIIRLEDFSHCSFRERAHQLDEAMQLHRKLWEFWAISRVYDQYIGAGGDCLGFGVGKEPLTSWLVSRGAHVMATDQPSVEALWDGTDQHARNLRDCWRPNVVTADAIDARGAFRGLDMNNLFPEDAPPLGFYDFTWSAGSFEHIGSFEHSIRFFCDQMRFLRPGGVAAHTTEFSANDLALESQHLVIFTEEELKELAGRLRAQGDHLLALDLRRDYDKVVDATGMPHINLQIGSFHVTTSILLVAIRGGAR